MDFTEITTFQGFLLLFITLEGIVIGILWKTLLRKDSIILELSKDNITTLGKIIHLIENLPKKDKLLEMFGDLKDHITHEINRMIDAQK